MTSVAVPSTPEEVAEPTEVATKRSFADKAELAWVWTAVGYSLLRFFVAWGAFAEHGANVWVFGIIDVGTAWPYAKAVAIVCRRAADAQWKRLPIPVAAAVVMFFAPYAYLWFAAGTMPEGVRFGFAICVTVLLVAATAGVLSKTRKLRRDAADSEDVEVIDLRGDAVTHQVQPDPTELVIDLTGDQPSLHRNPLPR